MSKQADYKSFTLLIGAGEEEEIAHGGKYIAGLSGTKGYRLRLDGADWFDFETGLGIATQEFYSLRVKNPNASPIVVKLGIAYQSITDNRLVGNIDISGGIRLAGNPVDDFTIALPAGATKILDANESRASVLLQNIEAAKTLYVWGDNTVSSANGFVILAGGTFTYSGQGELWARSSSGSCRTAVLEESL